MAEDAKRIKLPPARTDGPQSLESTLQQRRSVRSFAKEPLTLPQIAQLLWAGQGLSDRRGYRTAPSAGATYPLELLAAVGEVDGLEPGTYRYLPAGHNLEQISKADPRPEIHRAALSQSAVAGAPVVFVLTAVYERTLARYGERGVRYVHMEAGHAAQNLCLQTAALGLGSVVIGAFRDRQLQLVLSLGEDERPLYLIPVGR